MADARVALEAVATYAPEAVLAGLRRCLDHLGSMAAFVRPGQRVLLKPNLLGAFPPERAVTTHPAVVRAAAILVKEAGGIPLLGDSPGVGRYATVLAVTGMRAVMDAEGIAAADVRGEVTVERPDNRVVRRLRLAAAVAEADVIITLPKLKTHVQMALTGAVKNQFGLVVGAKKAQYHYRMGDRRWLARLLLDIDRAAAPALAIMDAIVGMEGQGPSGGEPRHLGLLLAGADRLALDRVACDLVGLSPAAVPLFAAARERGEEPVGPVATVGGEVAAYRQADWRRVEHLGDIHRLLPLPAALLRRLRRHLAPHPRIDRRRCLRCDACHDGCPTRPASIHPRRPPGRELDRGRCIRCYCCHEFCPVKAIDLQRSWFDRRFDLLRLVDRLAGG